MACVYGNDNITTSLEHATDFTRLASANKAERYLLCLDGLALSLGGVGQWAAVLVNPALPILNLATRLIHCAVVNLVLLHDLPSNLSSRTLDITEEILGLS